MPKKKAQVCFKMLSSKYVYKTCIFDIYVSTGFGITEPTKVDLL